MNYGFFDYKANISGYYGQDMFSTAHIVFMISAFLLMAIVCFLTRHASKRAVDTYLKVLSVAVPIIETSKIVWESYYDIKVFGGQFNYSGLLPLYACSLFIYSLPLAAWTKGKVKECALSFLTTLGIFCGLTNFIYLNILSTYPLLTYASFISIYFHFAMVFTGIFLMTTGYYRPKLKSVLYSMILFSIYALIVSVVNYAGNAYFGSDSFDYGFLYSGKTSPILCHDLQAALGDKLRPLYTAIIIIGYTLPTAVVYGVEKMIFMLTGRRKVK